MTQRRRPIRRPGSGHQPDAADAPDRPPEGVRAKSGAAPAPTAADLLRRAAWRSPLGRFFAGPVNSVGRFGRFMALNRGRGSFDIKAQAGTVAIYIYDAIVEDEFEAEFFGGIAASKLAREIRALDSDHITLRVNSPGGSVFGARTIEAALRDHPARVEAFVDGIAASAASFLISPADSIVMAPGAMMMVHRSMAFAFGNATDLLGLAARLEKIDGTIADTYARRGKMSAADFLAAMDAETWYTADEAVEAGLADAVAAEGKRDVANAVEWDFEPLFERARDLTPAGAALTASARERALEKIEAARRKRAQHGGGECKAAANTPGEKESPERAAAERARGAAAAAEAALESYKVRLEGADAPPALDAPAPDAASPASEIARHAARRAKLAASMARFMQGFD